MRREGISQFNVDLPESLINDFKKMINSKHQYYKRGLVSYEVEQALRQYLALFRSQSNTHTQSTKLVEYAKQNPIPAVHRLVQEIKQYLVSRGYYDNVADISCIPQHFLIESIQAIKGIDRRTVKKWLDLLKKYGSIKQLGDFQWEIV